MSMSGINANRFRMTGLNSGMDTASIVANLMNVERMSVNKIHRNKILSEWRLENYTKINSDLMTFSNKYLSALSKDSIMSAGAYMNFGANYKENSFFKVTGSAGIIPGNYKVTAAKMATYAQVSGTSDLAQQTQIDGKLTNHRRSAVYSEKLETAFGTPMTENTALWELKNADGTQPFKFDDQGNAKISINDQEIEVKSTDTVQKLMNNINAKTADTKVTASFNDGMLKLSSNDKAITVKNVMGTIFGKSFGIEVGTTFGNELKFGLNNTFAEIVANGGPDYLSGAQTLEFKINGKSYSVSSTSKLQDVINEVNNKTSASNGGAEPIARMSINMETGQFTIRSTSSNTPITIQNVSGKMFGADSMVNINDQTVSTNTRISTNDTLYQLSVKMNVDLKTDADGNFAFKINDKEFKFSSETTIAEVMRKVNASDAGVRMNFSQLTNSFTFTASKIGTDGKVNLGNSGSHNAFGTDSIFGTNQSSVIGTNASVTINGEIVERSSNNFTIDGMNFEITGDFTSATNPDGYNITFSQDVNSTVDKVKAFIEDYNKMIKELNGLVKEKKNYKFDPLLPEEEEEMTEKEIEKWTKEAKSGIMKNDPVLSSLLTNLRSAAYSIVGDTGMMASQIGITTKGTEGELQLDENVFKKALIDNPSKVSQIMTNTSSAEDPEVRHKESGFAVRLFNTMSQYRSNTRANQIQDETKKIDKFDTKILEMEKKLIIKEERYWRKYANLEKLMGNMNSQSSWLTAQLGALQ